MNTPDDLKYAKSHEWVKDNGDGTVTVGITDHAQDALGDIVFVELPQVGTQLTAGDAFGVVESVKAASDVYAPVSGEVLEVNTALEAAPETINDAPYATGWLMKLKVANADELDTLLDASAYQQVVKDS
jgi:glycine cleavage system H protein